LEQLGFENAKTSRDDQRLLTRAEELKFREWLIAENKTCEGKDRDEFGERLCEVLKKRQELFTKSRGRKAQALSTAAKACLKNGKPSNKWFRGYYARHASFISEKTKHRQDKKTSASSDRGSCAGPLLRNVRVSFSRRSLPRSLAYHNNSCISVVHMLFRICEYVISIIIGIATIDLRGSCTGPLLRNVRRRVHR